MKRVVGQSGVEMDLPEIIADGLLDSGVVRLVDEPEPEAGADQSTVADPAPAEDAPKTAWVEYACRVHGARFAEAKNLTKDELIARYGQPAGTDEPVEEQP